MSWDSLQQLIRIAAQWGAGAMAAKGLIDASMETMVVSFLVSLGALAWWLIWERKQENPVPPTV